MAKILLVDDRPVNRELLVILLEARGHRPLEADDGFKALHCVRAERPDLVLCDIVMAGMDGFEFVRQLRSDLEIARTQVIFCSAFYHDADVDRLARDAGVAHVLTMPCEPHELYRVVDDALHAPLPAAPGAAFEQYGRDHLRLVTNKLFDTVDALRNSNQRLQAIVELNLRLVSMRDPQQLLDTICRGARDLIGARHAMIVVRDPHNGEGTQVLTSGIDGVEAVDSTGTLLRDGALGAVVRERRPMRMAAPQAGHTLPGLPSGHPPVRSLLAAPIAVPDTVFGGICLTDKLGADAFDDEDEHLLSLLAGLVGSGYESGRLYLRLQRRAAEQAASLSARLVEVQELERRQLSRELHDRVGQNLTALGINLNIVRGQGLAVADGARARLDDSIALVEATADTIENVLAELRPPMLDDHGLLAALQWYAIQFTQRTGMEVVVNGDEPSERPDPDLEVALFRIVQEALNNVVRHAHATRVDIEFDQSEDELALSVSDNGVGFNPQKPIHAGNGLAVMRERAQLVNAAFEVEATPGRGTRVRVRMSATRR